MNVSKFYEKKQFENRSRNEYRFVEYTELLVPDMAINRKRKHPTSNSETSTKRIQLISLEERPLFAKKTVTISNKAPTTIQRADIRTYSHEEPSNLLFDHYTISHNHAELKVTDNMVYIRELGSEYGTKINNKRISPSGLPWTPRRLFNEDTLQIGQLKMELRFLTDNDDPQVGVPFRSKQLKFEQSIEINVGRELDNLEPPTSFRKKPHWFRRNI